MSKKVTPKKTIAKKAIFPVWAWGAIGLVLVVIVALVALNQPAAPVKSAALPAEITVQQAAQKQKEGAFILDVREPSEWNESHVAGATLIPLGQLSSRLQEVPRDKEVVVISRSGNRSADGRDILLGAGYPSVTSVAGGMVPSGFAGVHITTCLTPATRAGTAVMRTVDG